ncbi:hypothetical protein [Paenibacillus sp. LHD-38]|uniref:hypothetical protein n=1 Tax=Paenibacillus sp. LHD-38 TaxID=3072143 RepID=UPI00281065F4|nr:hypothetical protein [Paenibacillus sp. LHD-38]MDQ8734212.1 hypothetical protein [Paenibacillus sp. LHD-38]
MIFKKMIWVSMCIMILTACGDIPEQAVNSSTLKAQVKQVDDPILDFQREVIPVIEEAFKKHFPKKKNVSDAETLDSHDDEAIENFTDLYFDNDNLKVVFLVYKEDAKEMKSLRQELEVKLGDKVIFKKANFNNKDVVKKVRGYNEILEKQYSISVLETGDGTLKINMKIRSYGDVERKITPDEIDAIKKTLFEHVGQQFPLEITVEECCSKTDAMSGIIMEIDKVKKRILIPGTWLSLTDDAIIVSDNKEIEFDQLKIGQEVLAWSSGVYLTSDPGQTGVVKIQITQN